jgi:hypothetical protein
MLSHTGSLWQYLSSFLIYTLMTVGLIYGVYWYTRKASGKAVSAAPPPEPDEPTSESLLVESALPLEPQKTLYIIRSGSERFLISTTETSTQLLSRLEPVPPPVFETPETEEDSPMLPPLQSRVDLPWYADQPVRVQAPPLPPPVRRASGFGQRFVQSVQWLVASRTKTR